MSSINVSYVNEVECEVVPYAACEVIFGIQYMCRDATFYRIYNKYFLVKDDKSNLIKSEKERHIISLLSKKHVQTRNHQATLYIDGFMDEEKQVDAIGFHLLHGIYFGDKNPPNGEVSHKFNYHFKKALLHYFVDH